MKLDDLIIPTTTSMKVFKDGEDTNIVIHGYTPDSKEWRQAQKALLDPTKTPSVQLGKKGKNTMDIPNDPKAYEKRIKLLASVVTNIEGIEGWEFSPQNTLILFMNDGMAWMVEQWEDHMEDRSNFLETSESPAKGGSKASRG